MTALDGWAAQTNAVNNEAADWASLAEATARALTDPTATGTSTSSVTLGLGAKTFTTQSGKLWTVGAELLVWSGSSYMRGLVSGYASTTLSLNVTEVSGFGTMATWTIAPVATLAQRLPADGPLSTAGSTGTIFILARRVQPAVVYGGGAALTSGKGKWVATLRIDGTGTAVLPDVAGCAVLNTDYSSVTAISLPALEYMQSLTMPTGLTSFSAPALVAVGDYINTNSTALTSLNLPSLKHIAGALYFYASGMAALSLPSLLTVGGLSINSSDFSAPLLTTSGGDTYIRANSATATQVPSLTEVRGNLYLLLPVPAFTLPALATVIGSIYLQSGWTGNIAPFPLLTSVGSYLDLQSSTGTGISLPLLSTVGVYFRVISSTSLNSLSVPLLSFVAGSCTFADTALTSISLPSLTYVGGAFSVDYSMNSLVSLSAPVLQDILGNFGSNNTRAAFTTLTLTSALRRVGGNTDWRGSAFNQATVDSILVRLAALDGTGGTTAYSSKTVNLSGGTNATPSATGLAAKATLIARSCTVTHN